MPHLYRCIIVSASILGGCTLYWAQEIGKARQHIEGGPNSAACTAGKHITRKESNMKGNRKRIGMISALVGLLGVVGLGTVAYAQSADEGTCGPDLRERVREAIADVLDISVEE